MAINFGFQQYNINRALKKKGIDADLIDTHALIDRNLTIGENLNIIVGKQQKQTTSSENKIGNYLEASRIFNNMPQKRQYLDGKISARRKFDETNLTNSNFKKWKKSPNRYDIIGLDTPF